MITMICKMLRYPILQAVFLILVITACASTDADLYSEESTSQDATNENGMDKEIESLESSLEQERKARIEAESELEELKQQQNKTTDTVNDNTDSQEVSEIIKPPKKKQTVDIAAEYNKVVNAYVKYLNGLTLDEEASACSSDADLSELNRMQRAALRDACDIVGYRDVIAKPIYPRREQGTEGERQTENDDTMDSLIQIFDMVIRSVGR